MGLMAMRSGVEAEGRAAGIFRKIDEPLEHRLTVSHRTAGRIGDEGVNIEGASTPKNGLQTEAGDADYAAQVLQESELIAFGLLRANALDELFREQPPAQLA